jgi:hypothetical protein
MTPYPKWILDSGDDAVVHAYDEGVGAGNAGTFSACNPYYDADYRIAGLPHETSTGNVVLQAAWADGWRAGTGISPRSR